MLAVLMLVLAAPHARLDSQQVKKVTPRSAVLEAAMDSVIRVFEVTGLNDTYKAVDAVRKSGAIDISLYGRDLLAASEISRSVCQPHRAVPPELARSGNSILKYALFLASRAVLQKGVIAPVVITSGNYTQAEIAHRHFHEFQDYSDLWTLGYATNERGARSQHIQTEFFTIC